VISFEQFISRPIACLDCDEDIPSAEADVDIDDEGRAVAICKACQAERAKKRTTA
jgi:hypothetical protein